MAIAGGKGEEPSTAQVLGCASREKAINSPSVGTKPYYSSVFKNEMGNENRSQGQGTRVKLSVAAGYLCDARTPSREAQQWRGSVPSLTCWSIGKREGA